MITELEKFKFFQELNIRWTDMDPLGHVNNVYYIEYFQIGRGKFMMETSPTWDWSTHMFVIANINCSYYKEIGLNVKNPRIGVRISKLGVKSFEIEYVIISEGVDDVIVHAKGYSTQVMVNVLEKKSIELPDWFKKEVSAYDQSLIE